MKKGTPENQSTDEPSAPFTAELLERLIAHDPIEARELDAATFDKLMSWFQQAQAARDAAR